MAEYDPLMPDGYARHLLDLNNTNRVVAAEDITNINGLVLVARGLPLKLDVAEKILSHRLAQPLEMLVSLEKTVGAQQLLDQILAMLTRSAACRTIHAALNLDQVLIAQCRIYGSYPLLVQKLTVMADRLPADYQKALFCCWFCLCVGVRLGMQGQELTAVFIAGLAHDLGMLHIDPAILTKKGSYSPDEWRAMQSHAVVGEKILSYLEGLPEQARRAVREHHERCDGTGYPFGLFEDRLSRGGQVVAMADTLYAICSKPHGVTDRDITLAEAIPLLQINSTVHTQAVYNAVMQVLRLANASAAPAIPENRYPETLSVLLRQREQLNDAFSVAMAQEPALREVDVPLSRSALMMIRRLWVIVAGSGLIDEPLVRWLQHVGEHRIYSAEREIFELALMYEEFAWQLSQLGRLFRACGEDVEGIGEPVGGAVSAAGRSIIEGLGPFGRA